MLKRLHLFISLLLLAVGASAQGIQVGGTHRLPELPDAQRSPLMQFEQSPRYARFSPRRAVTVDPDRQMWWGYYPDDQISTIGLGSQGKDIYWAAIGIPASESMAQGKTIRAARFILDGTPGMKNFHFWIADHLPQNISEVALDIPVKTEDLVNEGFTELELPSPYAVPAGKTLYVGYTFEIAELVDGASYPLIIRYNGANIEESLWLKVPSLGGDEWMDDFVSYGPLAVQVLLDGEFPHNALAVNSSFLDVFALADGTAEATITLTSKGLGQVSSIDYIVGDANSDLPEQHLDIKPFSGMNATATVRIPLKADAQPGRTIRYITITKVNGVDNVIENAITSGYFVTLTKAVPRKTVVEEFTGTWCGWCPRGIVGLEKINEKFGDEAITIAIHSDDPMAAHYGVTPGSYPMAYVDRGFAADPYYGITDEPAGICDLVTERHAVLAEASVNLQSPTLAKSGSVTFKTEVTFNYDNPQSNYAIGYVLIADGLKGSGKSWAQANYYSGNANFADDPNLKPWVDADGYVPQTYDHVAVAAKGMDMGGAPISAPIVDGKVRTLNGNLSISGNSVLQSFENLKVVAVLFNTQSGIIVNADVQPVTIAEDFSQNRMQVQAFEQSGALKGEPVKVNVPVANFGRNGIKSIDYLERTDAGDSEPMHLDLKTPITTYGVYQNVEFTLPAKSVTGLTSSTIVITQLNGAENEATAGKTAKGNIMVVAKTSKRKTVIEEFTGTWCQWCPRGAAGLKRAAAEYPDDAVLMAIHGGRDTEPMQVNTFATQLKSIGGYPSAHVNRYRSCDPYMGDATEGWGLGAVIESENRQTVEASVELHQPTLEQSTGIITFTTDVTFQINREKAPYLLSYVLVGDGLKGEGDAWLQVNAYAAWYPGGYADDPYMHEICTDWEIYADVEYNHVALAGLGVDTGVSNSLKATVEEGQVQSHTGKISTKSNKLVKMAKKMRVIAMLYDKTAKRFINADEKEVVIVDAIEDTLDPTVSDRETARYSLDGKLLVAPTRGINLVRMADGSVRKVLVK